MGRLKNLAKNSPAAARASVDSRYGEVATLGLSFVLALVMGTALGWWLDNKFGWAPYGVLTGLGFGLAAGIRSAYVVLKPILKSSSTPSSNGASSGPTEYDDRP
jgi:F0F1-type ATP synthase assembly protein I